MSEESVGKITLDLELKSDLEGQINKISQLIAENLSKSMEQATKTMFDSINDNMKKSMQSSNNTLKSGLDAMNKTVQSNMKNTLAATSNIKPQQVSNNFPKPNIQKPVINTNFAQPVTRPPPKYDLSQLKAQIEDAERVLNTTNDQIDRQKDKIEQLKVAYDQAFNIAKKSKLSDDLLRAEARLNSLISKSDRYGFKLADLDAKYTAIAEAETRAAEVANTEATAINKVTEATNSNTIAAEKKGTSLKKASDSIKGFIDEEKIMQKGAAATNKNTQAVNSKGKALKSASLNVANAINPMDKVSMQGATTLSRQEVYNFNGDITIDSTKITDITDIINVFKKLKQESVSRGGAY
jgi:hypothetical protein